MAKAKFMSTKAVSLVFTLLLTQTHNAAAAPYGPGFRGQDHHGNDQDRHDHQGGGFRGRPDIGTSYDSVICDSYTEPQGTFTTTLDSVITTAPTTINGASPTPATDAPAAVTPSNPTLVVVTISSSASPTAAVSAIPQTTFATRPMQQNPGAATSRRQGNPGVFAESSGIWVYDSTAVTVLRSTISVPISLGSLLPSTSGLVPSSLDTKGQVSSQPFPTTVIVSTSATLAPTSLAATSAPPKVTPVGGNIFVPIAADAPPAQIKSQGGHPVARVGVIANQSATVETNKFYANLMLGKQQNPAWTQPYSLSWAAGGNANSFGMAISHIDANQYVYGDGNPAKYYATPNGINSLILSAAELGAATVMTTTDHAAMSVNVNFAPSAQQGSVMTLPLVQGMGFVTAIFTSATPLIQSGVLFKQLSPLTQVDGTKWKCNVILQDGKEWLIYVMPSASGKKRDAAAPTLALTSTSTIIGPKNWNGIIQVARITDGNSGETAYDASAGSYAIGASVSATQASGDGGSKMATYTLSFDKGGNTSKTLLMFALPHHVAAFDANTAKLQVGGATLMTTTKGQAQLVAADAWTMNEALPTSMGFAPWSPNFQGVTALAKTAQTTIATIANAELSEDMNAQTNLNSMYYSGKALAKFAAVVYTAHDLVGNPGIATAGLIKLKAALDVFVQNKQQNPLVYDTVWKGVVSTAGYKDSGADFGNTYYNDHHFHYGYFIYTAAVIAYVDPAWLNQGTNKAYINMLVRDYANSATDDQYYPFSRNFDWYHGHSWAKGIYESGAGKDQESSSEDTFASYALKMWGKVTGDANMEARGNLMLAIQARSLNMYYLMETTNTVQPQRFIGNKAAGILFEGKIDHTTYFGTNIEYIEGIHMLPIAPNTGLTRSATFVSQEWQTYFDNGRAQQVAGGWRGVLMANLAYVDAKTSWNFFADPKFDPNYLDGGASRTWYLATAAALGGVS